MQRSSDSKLKAYGYFKKTDYIDGPYEWGGIIAGMVIFSPLTIITFIVLGAIWLTQRNKKFNL